MKYKKILSLLVLLVTTATGYAQSAIALSANSDGTWSAPAYTSVIPLRMEVEYEQDPAQIYNLTDNGNGTWSIGSIPNCSRAIMVVEYIEAYACYTSSDHTLTFYYDNLRSSRSNTYDLNTGGISPVWMTNGTYDNVTKVVFDPSLAGVRLATTFGWLYGMTKLKTIEGMSYLNTSEVTNMSYMFYYCNSLKSLNLSNFNTSKVAQMDNMFGECSDLQTIYVGDGWNTEAVTSSSNMFYNCTSLVGGKNTAWNASNPKDMTYAHIDGGSSNPGYFTYRNTGITTDIGNVQRDAVKVQSEEWFTIDGQKLSGKPTKKGVYIYNGRAVVL